MGNFVNTVNLVGDKTLTDSILQRTVTEFHDNLVKTIGTYAFRDSQELTSVKIPNVETIEDAAFNSCPALALVDINTAVNIKGTAFSSCTNLVALIMRSTTTAATVSSNALEGTAIANGTGYIYVPRVLLSDYKAAANWITYAAQFRAIEDYPEICG